ncbi:MAG: glutamate-cysteine ligase family protein [Methanobacterium sp. ERen5]|nr:MAG: glutamate-cysteine ligase family protein [Methanobacterium sp. ERen5]
MNEEDIKKLIYQRYIEPTKQKRDVYAGIELELPLINLDKAPLDFKLIHKLTEKFKTQFNFNVKTRDDDGNICCLEDPKTDDIYTYDCSYNNLEISFGKEKNLHRVEERFREYYKFIQETINPENHYLTGFGVNPYRNYNKHLPVPNGRYRMLYNHLCTYSKYKYEKYFHDMPEYGMFTSAAQTQVDVNFHDLIKTIHLFSILEPIKAVLFSNSVLNDGEMELACSRDMLWEDSMQGYNKKNVGMYEPLPETMDELLDYMLSTSIYCTEKDGKYINFPPRVITDFYQAETIYGEYYQDGNYHPISFEPNGTDFKYLRSFKFEDLTFRGTLEFRSVCTQPVNETMTVHSFHMGLINQLDELNQIFETDTNLYNQQYSLTELRNLMVRYELPDFVDKNQLQDLTVKILDLATQGLKTRGYNEEKMLKPLYKRIKLLENPGQQLIKHLKSGGEIEDKIREYAQL